MGIRRMEGYLEHCNPFACYSVNITDVVTSARNNGENTTIVIDGLGMLRHLYGDLPWAPGGQMKQFEERVRDFVQQFLNLGTELIVIFDGPPAKVKMTEWKKRRLEKLKEVVTFFDRFNRPASFSKFKERLNVIPPNTGALAQYVFEKLGCKVVIAVGDCDEEIARYAYHNKCLAIIGQDTDFVVFRGAKHYWSMKHLNKSKMTTMEYDGRALARSLELSYSDLPLLASLLGNDLVPINQLSAFHRRLVHSQNGGGNINFESIIQCVARYIRSFPPGVDSSSLRSIAEYVFKDSTKADLLQASIRSYDITLPAQDDLPHVPSEERSNWHNVLLMIRERQYFDIYGIAIHGIFHGSNCLEDYRCKDIPLFREVMRTLRQKMYGIVLYDKPVSENEEKIVEELIVSDPASLNSYHRVPALCPEAFHPGLEKLWSSNDPEVDEMRWALLCSSVNIDHKALRSSGIPASLFSFVLALKYLLDEGVKMLNFELDALIASAVLLSKYTCSMLERVPLSQSNSRRIRLYCLVTRAFGLIISLNNSCGRPISTNEIKLSNYQDGKLFQYKCSRAKDISVDDLCENDESKIALFHSIRNTLPTRNCVDKVEP